MKLSKEEKELVIKLRAEKASEKPFKIAYAKHDLYIFHSHDMNYEISGWLFSPEEKNEEIANFISEFELVVNKGVKFECYLGDDGIPSWYDTEYGLEYLSEDWAEKNLEKFKLIKK